LKARYLIGRQRKGKGNKDRQKQGKERSASDPEGHLFSGLAFMLVLCTAFQLVETCGFLSGDSLARGWI
jgi:hypothetical protein